MIIQFPTTTVSPVILGDDIGAGGAGRWTVEIESWGAESKVQEEELPQPNGGVPFLRPLGNTKGVFAFCATKSFATIDLAAADYAAKLALLNKQDVLEITVGTTAPTRKFRYASAILMNVQRNKEKSAGVKWCIQYQFKVGVMTFV